MITGFNFWQFTAGISVFIFAMALIESSLKYIAGRSFKKFLQKHSQSKLKAVLAGTVVTGFLQSSSVALFMTLSFVSAGLMNLRSALSVVLGSNLGSTVSSWVIVLVGFRINLGAISYPVLGLALVGLLLFRKNTKMYHATGFLIGFAFIFISLEWLKGCVDVSGANIIFAPGELALPWYVLIGLLFTALVQSSSITMAIALSALYNNLLPFESAVGLVLGSETGTTLKFLISSINGLPDKKRVAWGNFLINVITMLVLTVAARPLINLLQNQLEIKDNLIGLVTFQSTINIISIILFLPVLNFFATFLEKTFKESSSVKLTRYIHKTPGENIDDQLITSGKETLHLVSKTLELNKRLLGISREKSKNKFTDFFMRGDGTVSLTESYNRKKILHGEILEYLAEIPRSEESTDEIDRITKLIKITRHTVRSSKNLKDIYHNLKEFEETANDELYSILAAIRESEKEFYKKYYEYLDMDSKEFNQEISGELQKHNRQQYDKSINHTLEMLRKKEISEIDSSTLLNVHREIYSSNKALIEALADLKSL
jgi:phosphate:Na+ symporter